MSGGEEGLKGVTNTQGDVIMQGIVTGERCSWPTLGIVAGEEQMRNAKNVHAVKTHPGRPRHKYGPPIEAQVVNNGCRPVCPSKGGRAQCSGNIGDLLIKTSTLGNFHANKNLNAVRRQTHTGLDATVLRLLRPVDAGAVQRVGPKAIRIEARRHGCRTWPMGANMANWGSK